MTHTDTSSVMVVLSGGQDSATCLLVAKRQYRHVHAITFDYGQRHRREIDCAKKIAELVGVDSHTVVDVRGLLLSRSPLVDKNATLETYNSYDEMDKVIGNRIELTFVPLRNPLFLLVAANHALARNCYTLMTGVCAMDNANYPDCTQAFLETCELLIEESLGMLRPDYDGTSFTVRAPLLHKTKAETVLLADQSGALGYAVMANTHTCYAGEYPPCGKCHSCVLRAEGFREAGLPDPLVAKSPIRR